MTDRFDQALGYASRLHRGQHRKGAQIPYVAHLLAVTSLVLEHGGNEDEAIAALLHDSIEDVGGESLRDQIREQFGPAVLAIVEGCTDTGQQPKPPWRERKQAFIDRLPEAAAPVRLVVAADKLHNVRSMLMDHARIGDRLWQRFRGGRDGTLWYYRAVADTLGKIEKTPLVEELDRAVRELELAAARAPGG